MKKVKASWIVSLPYGAVLSVKKGDKVKMGEVVFEASSDVEKIIEFQANLRGLSKLDIEKINEENKGKKLEAGSVLFDKRGLFSKKIICPESGKFGKIDELLNLHLIVGVDKRKVVSPIDAIVGDVGEDELKLEFGAFEFLGKGMSGAKGWVDSKAKRIANLTEINASCKKSLILVDKLTATIKLKAEVVGVGAIVVLDQLGSEDVRINFKIPSVAVDEETFNDLQKAIEGKESRLLVNGNSGRLLLVV